MGGYGWNNGGWMGGAAYAPYQAAYYPQPHSYAMQQPLDQYGMNSYGGFSPSSGTAHGSSAVILPEAEKHGPSSSGEALVEQPLTGQSVRQEDEATAPLVSGPS